MRKPQQEYHHIDRARCSWFACGSHSTQISANWSECHLFLLPAKSFWVIGFANQNTVYRFSGLAICPNIQHHLDASTVCVWLLCNSTMKSSVPNCNASDVSSSHRFWIVIFGTSQICPMSNCDHLRPPWKSPLVIYSASPKLCPTCKCCCSQIVQSISKIHSFKRRKSVQCVSKSSDRVRAHGNETARTSVANESEQITVRPMSS